jgi:hypothetical protein
LRFAHLFLLCVVAGGCVPPQGGWDADELARHQLSLRDHPGQRLSDAPPYFVPEKGGVRLFLCRWSVGETVAVSLPADASPGEERALRAALAAWEGAGLGLRFREVESRPAEIEIDFWQADRDDFTLVGAGNTVADCLLSSGLAGRSVGASVEARLSYASIYLRREGVNTIGEEVPYSEAELAGAALHELGHALGFPGHVAHGDSIMVRHMEVIQRHGETVMSGGEFYDATLAALYALPSGSVVGRRAVDPSALAVAWRIGERAHEEGWRGPYVRVGERSAQLHWRGPGGELAVLRELEWLEALRRPQSFMLFPNRAAVSLLGRSSGR